MPRKWHIKLRDFILEKLQITCFAAPDEKTLQISKQLDLI